MTPCRIGSSYESAVTDVMLPNSSARYVSFAIGRCSASFPGIVFVQIAPAAISYEKGNRRG